MTSASHRISRAVVGIIPKQNEVLVVAILGLQERPRAIRAAVIAYINFVRLQNLFRMHRSNTRVNASYRVMRPDQNRKSRIICHSGKYRIYLSKTIYSDTRFRMTVSGKQIVKNVCSIK